VFCWRIARRTYADLSGAGGLIYAARWNEVGHAVIYTSTSIALAALEYAAHSAVRPADSVLMKIKLPDDSLVTIEQRLGGPLPANWPNVEAQTQHLGSQWLLSNDSIALEVPSVIIPLERNLILNPKHGRFAEVTLVETLPFFFDPRIFNTGKLSPAPPLRPKPKRKPSP
jgi:RES domain-containing protein